MNREVVVIGGNHHNTLSILRSLGEKGIKSLLIVLSPYDPKPFVGYSKYIQKKIVVTNINEISSAMYSLHTTAEKAIVIACNDCISSYLDMNHNNLSKDFLLPGSKDEGMITHFMDKGAMAQLAVKSGLNIPKSIIISTANPEFESITYPCISKPLVSKNGSKSDIVICEDESALRKYLNHCRCDKIIIQEYISKDIEFQLIGCSIKEGDKIIIPGVSIILRQPMNGNTGFLRYFPIKEFTYDKSSCFEFIRSTGYSGLFSVEFIRDKNGTDYFMEINFRNDGNSICVTASGMNLPYIWYLYNCGENIESELCYDSMREVLVMPEFQDFKNVKHRQISLSNWLKDVKKTDRFMVFSKHDQKPFWMVVFKQFFH